MINIFFDNKEYFAFSSAQATHNIDSNLAFKEVRASAVSNSPFLDFIIALTTKKRMLARVFFQKKLYMEGFVTLDHFDYKDTPDNGTEISIIISDRFIGVKESDIITTKPKGSLQNFLANILSELNYDGSAFINTYQKKINTTADFVANGIGIEPHSLKSFSKKKLADFDSADLLGKLCSIEKVLLVSNGYDTLTFEKPNSYVTPVYTLFRSKTDKKISNISYAEKTNQSSGTTVPSKVIILNSADKKDNNTSVTTYNDFGLPHVQKVNHLSVNASYQDISNALNFNFAGITARSNSFLYKVPGILFDKNGDFFAPNRPILMRDEKYGISEVMSILQSGFTIDANNGIDLTLNLTTQLAFDNNASIKQKRSLMRK